VRAFCALLQLLWINTCNIGFRSQLRIRHKGAQNMKRTPLNKKPLPQTEEAKVQDSGQISSPGRRSFLGKLGTGTAATVAAGVLGSTPTALASINPLKSVGANLTGSQSNRVAAATALRIATANADAALGAAPHTTNGDELRYADKSASYSKGLLQDSIGVVNHAAWESFKKALNSGKNSDFEAIIIGGTRTQNGPQGSYAFDLECPDSSQFGNAPSPGDPNGLPVVPPFYIIAGREYAAQLVEQYWASMLRDV